MISPDGHVRDRTNSHASLVRQLRAGAVLVQSRHGKPAITGNVFRVFHRNQTIRVAWISDYEHAHIGRGIFLDRLTLSDENFAVDSE